MGGAWEVYVCVADTSSIYFTLIISKQSTR